MTKAFLLIVVILVLGGCSKESPYIKFGKVDAKPLANGRKLVQHYVAIADPKTGQPIRALTAKNFKVGIGGSQIEPLVLYSTTMHSEALALAVIVDQGGNKGSWGYLKEITDYFLKESETGKYLAAIQTANGDSHPFVFGSPTKARGLLNSLRATGAGTYVTAGAFSAIMSGSSISKSGISNEKTQVGVLAVLSGPPSSPLPELPAGTPVVIVDLSRSGNSTLISYAEKHDGLYISAEPSRALGIAKQAMQHFRWKLGDLYVINFEVDPKAIPLRYTLALSADNVNTAGDYVDDYYTKRLAVLVGIAAAILTIVVLVFMRSRRSGSVPKPVPQSAGWSSGEYTIAAPNMGADGDATTAGSASGSHFGVQQSASFSAATDATAGEFGGGGAAFTVPGDVTAGALNVDSPTIGSYVSAGDSTMAEGVAVPAGFSSYGPEPAMLRVETGSAAGQEISIIGTTRIGRGDYFSNSGGQVVIPGDPRMSRTHAEIRADVEGGSTFWTIANLSSTNKTYVNDMPIDGPRRLSPNDRIRIGDTTIRVASLPSSMGDSTLR